MTRNPDGTLQRLNTVLEVYGAQSLSWPDEERDVLLKLIRDNIQADQMYREAKALEHVLDHSRVSTDISSLQSKIMAKVSEQSSESNVADFSSHQKKKPSGGGSYSVFLQNVSLLAASLIIGIYIGTTDSVSTFYPFGHIDTANLVNLVPVSVDGEELPFEEKFL